MKYDQIDVGATASFEKTISEADVYGFAGITGDFNPAHINQRYAEKTMFRKRIVHGMLTASLFSTVMGTQLPGPGAIYMSQTLAFPAAVYIGDTVKATVTVTEKLDHNRIKLACVATRSDGTVVVRGEAVLIPPVN